MQSNHYLLLILLALSASDIQSAQSRNAWGSLRAEFRSLMNNPVGNKDQLFKIIDSLKEQKDVMAFTLEAELRRALEKSGQMPKSEQPNPSKASEDKNKAPQRRQTQEIDIKARAQAEKNRLEQDRKQAQLEADRAAKKAAQEKERAKELRRQAAAAQQAAEDDKRLAELAQERAAQDAAREAKLAREQKEALDKLAADAKLNAQGAGLAGARPQSPEVVPPAPVDADHQLLVAASADEIEDARKALADGANPNSLDGKNALIVAIQREFADIVALLLDTGVLNQQTKEAAFIAASKKDNRALLERLVQLGGFSVRTQVDGQSALVAAAEAEADNALEYLLSLPGFTADDIEQALRLEPAPQGYTQQLLENALKIKRGAVANPAADQALLKGAQAGSPKAVQDALQQFPSSSGIQRAFDAALLVRPQNAQILQLLAGAGAKVAQGDTKRAKNAIEELYDEVVPYLTETEKAEFAQLGGGLDTQLHWLQDKKAKRQKLRTVIPNDKDYIRHVDTTQQQAQEFDAKQAAEAQAREDDEEQKRKAEQDNVPPAPDLTPDEKLHLAAINGDTAGVEQALADGANVDSQDERRRTALMLAAQQDGTGNEEDYLNTIKLLLQHHADLTLRDVDDETAKDKADEEESEAIQRLF